MKPFFCCNSPEQYNMLTSSRIAMTSLAQGPCPAGLMDLSATYQLWDPRQLHSWIIYPHQEFLSMALCESLS